MSVTSDTLGWALNAITMGGAIMFMVGERLGLLIVGISQIAAAVVSVYIHTYVFAGLCLAVAVIVIYLWWIGGGGDDFRKKRRKVAGKLKASFRKIASFRPAPLRLPTPVAQPLGSP